MRSLIILTLLSVLVLACSGVIFAQTEPVKPLPKQISGGILNGKATSLPKPEYPAAALAEKASGQVSVRVLIDEDGNVVSAKATSGPENAALRSAAEAAALQAKFTPTLLSGNPVKVSGVITYNFVAAEDLHTGMNAFMAAAILFTVKELATDPVQLKKALDMDGGELRSALKEAASDPEFPGLEPLAKLESTPPIKRVELVESVISSMVTTLKSDQAVWKFELGRAFTDMLAPVIVAVIAQNAPDRSTFDADRIRKGLKAMKQMLAKAPADIPKDILGKLNALAELADRNELLTEENIEEFSSKVVAVFNAVSPE